jgi:hypothetical protein
MTTGTCKTVAVERLVTVTAQPTITAWLAPEAGLLIRDRGIT